MKVEFIGFDLLKKSEQKLAENIISRVVHETNLDNISVNICLVDDETMSDLYFRFKHKNKLTDVLSFPAPEFEKQLEHSKDFLGDVVICLSVAQKQAQEYEHSLCEELAVLSAHGLMHLMGHDHEKSPEEANIQMQAEMFLLTSAGLDPSLCLIGRSQ